MIDTRQAAILGYCVMMLVYAMLAASIFGTIGIGIWFAWTSQWGKLAACILSNIMLGGIVRSMKKESKS